MTERQDLVNAIALSPIAMVLSNPRRPDNPLEIANPQFCALTGYPEAEIVGRNCRFLAGPRTDTSVSRQIGLAIREARPVLVDILNYRHDGQEFRNGVMITPIFGDEGRPVWFLGSQVDLGPAPTDAFRQRQSSAEAKVAALPPRQRQVLELMSRGLLNKQIAWELRISEKTVKMHRALMLDRLGVASSAEAIRIAVEAAL